MNLSFRKDWGNEVFLSSISTSQRGVAVMFGEKVDYKVIELHRDDIGNLLIVKIKSGKLEFILIVVYGPNVDTPDFYDIIKEFISAEDNIPLIICGDWNLVLDFEQDTFGYVGKNNVNARKKVIELCETCDLVDTWRCSNPNSKKYTWISGKRPLKMSRLDFFLVTPDIHATICKHYISFGYRTDHSFIGIEIDQQEIERNPGFWKFNNSILFEDKYVRMVKDIINETILEYIDFQGDEPIVTEELLISSQMLFEMIKLKIRAKTIPFCAAKKRIAEQAESRLEKQIENLEKQLLDNDVTDYRYVLNALENCQEQLKVLRQPKLQAAILRSKAQIYEMAEKPTSYFCNLEKRNSVNKLISRLNIGNNVTITNQDEILKEVTRFYKGLYTSKRKKNEDTFFDKFLSQQNIQKLDQEKKKNVKEL